MEMKGNQPTDQPGEVPWLENEDNELRSMMKPAKYDEVKIDTVYLSIIYSWEPPHAIPNSLLTAKLASSISSWNYSQTPPFLAP